MFKHDASCHILMIVSKLFCLMKYSLRQLVSKQLTTFLEKKNQSQQKKLDEIAGGLPRSITAFY